MACQRLDKGITYAYYQPFMFPFKTVHAQECEMWNLYKSNQIEFLILSITQILIN